VRRAPLQVDVRLRTKAEGFRWFCVHGQAIWNEAGQPVRVAGSILDITERHDAAQALRLSEERLRLALDGAGRALFDWNVETDEIFMSDYWAQLIGAPPAPMLTNTQALGDLIHPKDTPLQQRRLLEAIKGVRPRYEVEFRVLHKDGSWRWVQIEGVVVQRNDVGKALRLIGTIADVSERKEDERIKSEFISMVSHELRTPLTSIHGALGVAASGAAGELDAEMRGLLGIAHKNSQRLLRLANDILDIDRMEAGRLEFRMERHALPGLVAQAVSEVRPYADTLKVDIQREVAEALYVNVDEGRFIQVMTNLLANAAKFSPAGSIIQVAVARGGLNARVTVTDRGGGISEDFRRQLFQKFSQSRTKRARVLGGAGLGLNIVRTLTEAMGGQAGYYPASSGGSVFYIDLPEG
jgi:PAS domain S-box-containing protein